MDWKLDPVIKYQLKIHEGLSLMAYTDTTGHITIGHGRNLSDCGITQKEAEYLLENDIESAVNALDRNLPIWRSKPINVQKVLIDMCFNLGWDKLKEFHATLQLIEENNFKGAADQMLQSKWAKQVGVRAHNLANMMRSA